MTCLQKVDFRRAPIIGAHRNLSFGSFSLSCGAETTTLLRLHSAVVSCFLRHNVHNHLARRHLRVVVSHLLVLVWFWRSFQSRGLSSRRLSPPRIGHIDQDFAPSINTASYRKVRNTPLEPIPCFRLPCNLPRSTQRSHHEELPAWCSGPVVGSSDVARGGYRQATRGCPTDVQPPGTKSIRRFLPDIYNHQRPL
ncbi:hypothetical protein B0H15DRAFT_425913 [Mycena belliarum]|uniref:Uncharacterized protein n=1 Tax=Mycena belliarum TaxID=1033014 RepID=A0AAD6XLJ2_9AGAR|nr:hypothetical protein B0H15DRAFT_425913 [Mycena belliae]